jgi:D-amino-acid dehydrogenase
MGTALRFGGTMEFSGMDLRVNPRRVAGIVKSVPRYFPAFRAEDFASVTPWCGLRPCSPDGLPFLGRTAAAPNLIVATGHAMMGLSLAPVTGRIVADLVAGDPPPLDLRLLSPDRYA